MTATNIDEVIQVAMLFRGEDIRPAAFVWNGRRYDVTRILLAHKTRHGDVLRWHFNVETSGNGQAELLFDTLSLSWRLNSLTEGGV